MRGHSFESDGIRIFTDEGGGHTQASLLMLEQLLNDNKIGKPVEAWCVFEDGFNFQLYSLFSRFVSEPTGEMDPGPYDIDIPRYRMRKETISTYTLLSGLNCGYGGTGPAGLIEAIEMLGFELSPEQRNFIRTNDKVYFNFRGGQLKVSESGRPGAVGI